MSYKIRVTSRFEREAKKLKKKYKSIPQDLRGLYEQLLENPETGTPLGNGVYKIRMAIASTGKGKRGGARIISHVLKIEEYIYLIAIYSKGQQDDISDKEILKALEEVKKELSEEQNGDEDEEKSED
jgi:mRNA-degrading endonuclease RelE of RelBE toxin-antitoxin system